MEVCAYLVADAQKLELVEPRESALYHPTGPAQAGAVRRAASGDLWNDATGPQESAVLAEVIASVGVQTLRLVTGTAATAPVTRDRVQERDELGDVVPIAAGQRDGEWGTVAVDDHMVLAAGAAAIDW